MIAGSVNVFREAVVTLTVRGPDGMQREIAAVVDTGFNGSLTLPPSVVAVLALPFRRRARALLADGSESVFDVHEAQVLWGDQPLRVPVDAVDTDPLLGMGMLQGHELRIEAKEGGLVTIQKLS